MLKQYSQQHIRFAKIEKPDAWLIVAVLLEVRDGETVAISEPKVVKVIPKAPSLALAGSVASSFALAGGKESPSQEAIPSPYFPATFGYTTPINLVGVAPQPPTYR